MFWIFLNVEKHFAYLTAVPRRRRSHREHFDVVGGEEPVAGASELSAANLVATAVGITFAVGITEKAQIRSTAAKQRTPARPVVHRALRLARPDRDLPHSLGVSAVIEEERLKWPPRARYKEQI